MLSNLKTEIKQKLEMSLTMIEKILSEEKFEAYYRIEEGIVSILNDSNLNLVERRKVLSNCIRLIQEAPPKNKVIGMDLLVSLDNIYKELVD